MAPHVPFSLSLLRDVSSYCLNSPGAVLESANHIFAPLPEACGAEEGLCGGCNLSASPTHFLLGGVAPPGSALTRVGIGLNSRTSSLLGHNLFCFHTLFMVNLSGRMERSQSNFATLSKRLNQNINDSSGSHLRILRTLSDAFCTRVTSRSTANHRRMRGRM